MSVVNIKKLHPQAVTPALATSGSGGYDLSARIDSPVTICQHQVVKIPTGIAFALPAGTVGMLMGRSSLGIKHNVVPANGVGLIDSDYRGEIIVGLTCHNPDGYVINPNERIAQLVIVPVLTPELVEVETLDSTERGTGGFGSTGRI